MNSIRISRWIAAAVFAISAAAQDSTMTDAAGLARRAMQLQAAGDYAAAAEAYRQLLKIDPNQVATHVNLGVVLVNTGHYEEALAEYAAADKLLPNDPRIALNIALAYQKSGRIKEAAERFESLHSANPDDTRITMLLADCNLQMGNDQRVITLLHPVHSQLPNDLGVAYMLGMALLRNQQTAEGEKMLDQILRNGDTTESRFLLGVRIFEAQDYSAAVKQFEKAIILNPDLPGLQSFYGLSLLNTGDPDAAATAFRKELITDPNNYAANLGLGQILEVRQQFSDALPRFRQALLLRPRSAEAELGMAQCLAASNSFGEARPHAEAAVADLPESRDAHAALLAVYSGLRMPAEVSREHKKLQSIAAQAAAEEGGPKLNSAAPDFELRETATGKTVRLSDFAATRPTVLVFGSYSCPNFRSSAEALNAMRERYGSRANFLLVYIREAHSDDQWQSTRNLRESVKLAPAANMTEKEDHARMCSRKLHLNFPAVVDKMDGSVEIAYDAWPSRAFVIGTDRRVLYRTRLTELDFHADEMESVLRQVTAPKAEVARGKQP